MQKLPQHSDETIATALERYSHGEKLADIAVEYGVSVASLYGWLLSEVPEKYKAIQQAGLIGQLAESRSLILEASDHLDLGRARELRKSAQWDAERRLKKLFAPLQQVSGADGGPIMVQDAGEVSRKLAFLLADGPVTIDQQLPIESTVEPSS